MSVAALRDFREPARAPTKLVTVFCVTIYWRDRCKLAEDRLLQFGSMEAALRAGKKASVKAAGVRVFRWTGIAETNFAYENVTLATYGEVPEG